MTNRQERAVFVASCVGLWLVFVVQAVQSPVLLDDWFQLRYWRDHELGPSALWTYAHHNYFHYNPRLGEVLLAIIDGSRAVHLVATPLVQLALVAFVFVIAFARWPRPKLADLQLLLVIQTMIWLVVPIPGMVYFYRPLATNYLWTFAITLALVVPYRLVLAGETPLPTRRGLVPLMFVLGWMAGMCNEHTGPTAALAIAAFVFVAVVRHRFRAWMIAGLVGLCVGYPMLLLAPGQSIRYGGLATRDTPANLLAHRGLTGCLAILRDFIVESRLGLLLGAAAIASYLITRWQRRERLSLPAARTMIDAGVLAGASLAIVVTLFVSPTTTDRVLFASGVLLAGALSIVASQLFAERVVRRFVVGACAALFAYHVVGFIGTYAAVKAENDDRLARLAATPPGTVAVLPTYDHHERTRWHIGDDFAIYPWLRQYVGGQLYDLSRVDLDGRDRAPAPRVVVEYEPATRDLDLPVPTYRQLQTPLGMVLVGARIGRVEALGLERVTFRSEGVYDDPRRRPVLILDSTREGARFFSGAPYDGRDGHYIRVRHLPGALVDTYVIGCAIIDRVEVRGDLVAVDERYCRGPFTAVMCEPDRCWVAGWY
jgi:hypothetical protein